VGGVVASLASPHDSTFQDMFESRTWLLIMRVLIPMAALYSSVLALVEMRHLGSIPGPKSAPQSLFTKPAFHIIFIIHSLEAPSLISIALYLILGGYGPQMIPYPIFQAGYFLLVGTSVLTTLLAALFIQEELRAARNLARRIHSKRTIASIAFLCLGFDIIVIIFFMVPGFRGNNVLVPAGLAFLMIAQAGAGIVFFSKP